MKHALILLLMASCSHKPLSDIESIAEDVLKAKTGIEIEIKPIPKQGENDF